MFCPVINLEPMKSHSFSLAYPHSDGLTFDVCLPTEERKTAEENPVGMQIGEGDENEMLLAASLSSQVLSLTTARTAATSS